MALWGPIDLPSGLLCSPLWWEGLPAWAPLQRDRVPGVWLQGPALSFLLFFGVTSPLVLLSPLPAGSSFSLLLSSLPL